jgi:glutamate carboxypeptidase
VSVNSSGTVPNGSISLRLLPLSAESGVMIIETIQPNSTQLTAMNAFLVRRQDEILRSICRLVETESPSGDFEGSRAVVNLLVEIARTIPAIDSVERIAVPDYGEHLRVRAFDRNAYATNTTLVLGHTDTVHARGTLAKQSVRTESGRLFGPGIFDMKASVVLALEALRTLATLNITPQRPVVLLLTCDEETGSQTGRRLVEEEARRAAQALVLEPSAPGGKAKTSRKGVGMWRLKRARVQFLNWHAKSTGYTR